MESKLSTNIKFVHGLEVAKEDKDGLTFFVGYFCSFGNCCEMLRSTHQLCSKILSPALSVDGRDVIEVFDLVPIREHLLLALRESLQGSRNSHNVVIVSGKLSIRNMPAVYIE